MALKGFLPAETQVGLMSEKSRSACWGGRWQQKEKQGWMDLPEGTCIGGNLKAKKLQIQKEQRDWFKSMCHSPECSERENTEVSNSQSGKELNSQEVKFA